MSATEAVRFVETAGADASFAERLAAMKDDPAAVYALVRAEGYDCTPDEIRAAFLEAYGSMLTDEQLDSFAGGIDTDVVQVMVGVGASVGVAVGLAVAVF